MLDKRTTIALSVIAASLLAFILVFERGTLSTGELARRSGHVLTHFVRDRVTEVSLQREGEEAVVLVRQPPAEEGMPADYRVSAPVEADADQDAVDSLLGALEWLVPVRTLEGVAEADRARYGLDEPRFVVRFVAAGDETVLRVGGEAPEEQGAYAAVEGSDRVYIVGEDFVESVDHDLAHFRDKDLFPDDFYASDATAIRLDAVSFEKDGERWLVREPVRGWANGGVIDGLIRLAREVRIARFVAEDGELGDYGLDSPWRELTFTRPEDAEGTRSARLRVGAVCGEHHEERYAIVGEDGPVICLLQSELGALELDPSALRETRLVPASADAIERVVLEGAETITLARDEAEWRMTVGDGDEVTADAGAVIEWLGALSAVRASAFEPADGHALSAATLRVKRSDRDEELVVKLGESSAEGAWARRGEEPVAMRVDAAGAALLAVTPLRFRARGLVSAEAGDARSLTVRAGGLEERAVRGEGGSWRLEAPIEAAADRVVVREVTRAVAELQAERFVAAEASPEHGLASPARTVTVGFEDEEVTLRIGAVTEGGRFAQLEGDEAVFVLADATLEGLESHLVSRDALTVDVSDAEAIRLERAGSPAVELGRDGSRWRTADGAEADAERTRALLDRLSSLRASGVSMYEVPDLAPPTMSVTVTLPDGPASLSFHASDGEMVQVVRSGVDVVYVIDRSLLAPLRDYAP